MPPKEYAPRNSEERERVGWNVPKRLKTWIHALALATGRSESMVVTQLLDSIISGGESPLPPKSQK